MTTTDWIIDIALVLIVVRQIREERIGRLFLLLPLGIVAYVAHTYLTALPTGGNDLMLLGLFLGTGAALGAAGGLLTHVRGENGTAFVRAGWAAATLWIVSMSARLGFIIWITHSSGAASLAHFSAAHHVTSGGAWQDALVLLALAEVVVRVGIIAVRGSRLASRSVQVEPAAETLICA